MRKLLVVPALSLAALAALFPVAGRPVAELVGLVRASADHSVDSWLDSVPVEVRDKKLDRDLDRQRQSVLDREVQLSLSRRQLDALAAEVADLEARVDRRQRLLVEAYPVLERAADEHLTAVRFAGLDRGVEELQGEVDALLAEQEREERQLAIKRTGLERLERSVRDGEEALSQMRDALANLELEIDELRARREQARLEAETLDLVAEVAAPGDEGTLGGATAELREEVETMEVRNEARRGRVPGGAATDGGLLRDFERLERLRAIREASLASTAGVVDDE